MCWILKLKWYLLQYPTLPPLPTCIKTLNFPLSFLFSFCSSICTKLVTLFQSYCLISLWHYLGKDALASFIYWHCMSILQKDPDGGLWKSIRKLSTGKALWEGNSSTALPVPSRKFTLPKGMYIHFQSREGSGPWLFFSLALFHCGIFKY